MATNQSATIKLVHRYIPIMRWKRGEQTALANLPNSSKLGVAPLFLLGQDQHKEKKATKNLEAVAPDKMFCDQVIKAWGSQAFFLDAYGVTANGASHPITAISAIAVASGLQLIPATRLDYDQSYQNAVVAIAKNKKTGMALRVDLQEMTSAQSWVSNLPLAPSLIDLIVDLEDSAHDVVSLGATVGLAFGALHVGTAWRSVTLAGTSLPENFSGVPAGLHRIPRSELKLWKTLTAGGLPYRLDFGDYGTISANPPIANIPFGFPINVKYTTGNNILVCRGVRTTGPNGVPMADQLIAHARSIVSYSPRNILAGCWADDTIDDIASGAQNPGNLETWVSISMNRHIARTRYKLP